MESSGHHTLILCIFCCNLFGPPERLVRIIQCLLEMITWFAAYDRINYARYLPAYVLQMMTLPGSHPDAHTIFINGELTVQRSTRNSFGCIPHDQTIEVTANWDTKWNSAGNQGRPDNDLQGVGPSCFQHHCQRCWNVFAN